MTTSVSNSSKRKTRYAICGLSVRGIYHFVLPLLGKSPHATGEDYSDHSELVGILDIDQERTELFRKKFDIQAPWFSASEGVDAMIQATKPDVLLVASPDYTHCEYIVAGLKHNLKVIAEKPVVISAEQMLKVLAAERESKGTLIVAHNYRYNRTNRQIKKLLMEGRIGKVTNIEFTYNLDTFHGASYFYRWNRLRARSGGLSIHKSVHHIDMINWLIQSSPETVYAFGGLNYYGANGAHRPKSKDGHPLTIAETREQCPYFQQNYAARGKSPEDPLTPGWDEVELPYHVQYPKDRYIYDAEIDIEDTYSAVIRYQNGATMTYSCNFSTPWEGFKLGINGTDGRIEASHHSDPDPTGKSRPVAPQIDKITLMPLFGGKEEYNIELAQGGHGGADPIIRNDLFNAVTQESLDYQLPADSYEGAVAIVAGEAIWRSSADHRPYSLKELLGEFYREEKQWTHVR